MAEDNLMFKIRSVFDDFERRYALLNSQVNMSPKKLLRADYAKQIEVPAQSFEQKWDLNYGAGSFEAHRVLQVMLDHMFVFCKEGTPHRKYTWHVQAKSLPTCATRCFCSCRKPMATLKVGVI